MNGRGCVRFIPIEANINRENACASSLFFLIHSFSIFSNASQINCFSVEGRLLKKSSPVHGGIGSSPTKHVCNSAHGFGVGFPSCLAINAWHKFTLLNGCCFFCLQATLELANVEDLILPVWGVPPLVLVIVEDIVGNICNPCGLHMVQAD